MPLTARYSFPEMVFSVTGQEQLKPAAEATAKLLEQTKTALFYGDMGAGKTTFIKVICACLGVTDTVSSPTFSIINEYSSPSGPIFHFDFYRIKDQAEALDIGFEDYIYSGNVCLIEWPEKIPDLLPAEFIRVNLEIVAENERIITIYPANTADSK